MAKKKRSRNRNQSRPYEYPIATVAWYGPDDKTATKAAVGIVMKAGAEPAFLERWLSEGGRDLRNDPQIAREITAFIDSHHVGRVVMVDRIIGCPHEEGIDYPEGAICPRCPFWEGRDRWTGLMVN